MVDRGLLPDFSPEALAELSAVPELQAEPGELVRDLRKLAWCSIDNDVLVFLGMRVQEESR